LNSARTTPTGAYRAEHVRSDTYHGRVALGVRVNTQRVGGSNIVVAPPPLKDDNGGVTTSGKAWVPTHDEPLFLLAMDQRASFARLFGVSGTPDEADLKRMRDAKSLIYEGLTQAKVGASFGRVGVLVDEDLGAAVIGQAKSDGVVLAMPIEKSGSRVFELEYGDAFSEHVEKVDPDFFKVLVRYNPADDDTIRRTQLARLAKLSAWAEGVGRRWLFELLVPPTPDQLAACGDQDGFDREARPGLTAQVISQFQGADVHPTIWKLEGYETTAGAELVLAAVSAETAHPAVCIVLGRDAPLPRVEHWLEVAAGLRRYAGFAVGRSIWEHPLEELIAGTSSNRQVVEAVAATYKTLVDTYTRAHLG
jgi:myo-inositol catabolism protein IolC